MNFASHSEAFRTFAWPTRWLLVPNPDAVPMSATGKVEKPALQQLLHSRGVRCEGTS